MVKESKLKPTLQRPAIFQTQDTPGSNRDTPGPSSFQAKAETGRHRLCWEKRMITRLQRLDLSLWEMVAVAFVVGLVAAAFVALPVG